MKAGQWSLAMTDQLSFVSTVKSTLHAQKVAFRNFSTANNSESSNTKWTLMQDRIKLIFHGQSNKNLSRLGIFSAA